jgi:Peptidase A4 family
MLLGQTVRSLFGVGLATMLPIVTMGLNAPIASAVSGTPGPAASLPVQRCSSGINLNLPTSSSIEADGWMRIDYDLGGLNSYTELPPVGFDPQQAPAEVVARHQLPSRPETTTPAQWTAEMGRLQWDRTQGICGPLPFNWGGSYYDTYNWGGDAVRSTSTYDFLGVQAYQTQSQLTSDCGPWSSLGSWVGLGGDLGGYSAAFLQAGTWVLGPAWGRASYGSFYQYFDSTGHNYGAFDLNMFVNPSDSIYETVTRLSPLVGHVMVWDISTGDFRQLVVATPNSSGLGDFAQWIDERQANQPLDNYRWTAWSSMDVFRHNAASWTGAYSEPKEYWIEMYNNPTNWNMMSATTGTYSDNHMQDHWLRCQ